MQERIIIAVGKDWDGFTFRLRPKTREMLRAEYPDAKMLPQVSISYDGKAGFDVIEEPVFRHVLEMLAGINYNELQRAGGARFLDAVTEELVYDTVGL